ncbi:hypothetical protein ACCO45_008257 [Purpureocillium lilacinum]|uniref:Uncharacterized protein n=1 Tax=Purpureocillium lilacinum TaxID=33203 RepID=A0ACC4DMZ5_PURLI
MADLSLDSYWQLPPLSRTLATATFGISLAVHTGLLPGWWFVWAPRFLWMFPPQIWRFATAFLITGPNLGLLFDTYFLYSYLSQLEIGNPRFPRKEDLIWYLMFVGGTIMTINYLTGFGFVTFLQALVVAICYTVTQDQRGMKVSYMFITIPAQLMPYAMILINLLFPGGVMNMILQAQGSLPGTCSSFSLESGLSTAVAVIPSRLPRCYRRLSKPLEQLREGSRALVALGRPTKPLAAPQALRGVRCLTLGGRGAQASDLVDDGCRESCTEYERQHL